MDFLVVVFLVFLLYAIDINGFYSRFTVKRKKRHSVISPKFPFYNYNTVRANFTYLFLTV